MTNKEKANKINNLIIRKKELEIDINMTLKEIGINGHIPICPEFPNFPDNLPHNRAFEDLIEIKLPIGYLLNYFFSSCILRVKDGLVIKTYTADEEFSRGAQLHIACDEAQAGEVLYLSKGKFNINGVIRDGKLLKNNKGLALVFPTDVTFIGMGISDDEEHRTTLYGKFNTDKTCGPAFQLQNNYLQNLVIEGAPSSDTADVKTIGFHEIKPRPAGTDQLSGEVACGGLVTNSYEVTISNCHIISNAWGFYSSSNKKIGDSCIIKNSIIESNRQGISLMGRGHYSNRNKMKVYNCKFVIDGRTPYPKGRRTAVSRMDGDETGGVRYQPAGGVYGVISRGTELLVKDSSFELIGSSKETANKKCPLARCIGISDVFDNGNKAGQSAEITSVNNTFYITANDAENVHAHLRMKDDSSFKIKNSNVYMLNKVGLPSVTTHISYELDVTLAEEKAGNVLWYPVACNGDENE